MPRTKRTIPRDPGHVVLYCDVVELREKAVKLERDGHTVWIPLSTCHAWRTVQVGQKQIIVKRWVAEQRGLLSQ